MNTHYFISYSQHDADEFALKLYDALEDGPPSIPMWIDQRDIKTGYDWDSQIVEAIRVCDGLIFIMTNDSVDSQSICKPEWSRALKYKKPIIPIRLHNDIETPLQLENLQYIDFTRDFNSALARLRNHLQWLKTPEGILQELDYRLNAAMRDIRRAPTDTTRLRIKDEIKLLKKQVAQQQHIVNNPQKIVKIVNESISRGIDRERRPAKSPDPQKKTAKFINSPPAMVPSHFQDRETETKLIADFLKNPTVRLLTVRGRGGTGKTVLVCRVLKIMEKGILPDKLGKIDIDGIVYLSSAGSKQLTFPNLYSDLCRFLPFDKVQQLNNIYKSPYSRTEYIMTELLKELADKNIIVFLDSFEDVVDPLTHQVKEIELNEALLTLLKYPGHSIKTIITTRIISYDLARTQPAFQAQLNLDDGLTSPYAENILREMDLDGKIGLKDAPVELLKTACLRTRGYPRALEALFAILASDRDTSLEEILADTRNLLPGEVTQILVGEAFSRLDFFSQKVMETLAVYGIPVTPVAVDYLLQPHFIGLKSAFILKQLVNMQFVHKESGKYCLHPVDRDYSLSRIPTGTRNDWKNGEDKLLYTQYSLRHRGAEYFKQIRKPQSDWKNFEDLAPQLAEFELRFAGEEYQTAAAVLNEISNKYLNLWGYYQLSSELHERLLEKIENPYLKRKILGILGLSYFRMGEYRKAKKCFERELELNIILGDHINLGKSYGNIGACHEYLRQINRAMVYYHKTLNIARDFNIRVWEAVIFCNLGNCYSYLGKIDKSIEYLEKSLAIDRELKDRENENISLTNLGMRYTAQGNYKKATGYYRKSLKIAREIGSKRGEAFNYYALGNLLMDKGDLDKACLKFQKAIRIADDIGLGYVQFDARIALARNYLFKGDVPMAEAALEASGRYDEPSGKTTKVLLTGLAAVMKGDLPAAKKAFKKAMSLANEIIEMGEADETYSLLIEMGLIYSGLAISLSRAYIPKAIDAFSTARAIYKEAAVSTGVYCEFDILAAADKDNILSEIKEAVPDLCSSSQSLNSL
jgi:tetratricopeptide (TPR) repeat protein